MTHLNWAEQYKRIRGILDIRWPGYMIHESGIWSDVHQRWFFLPRRCSHEVYNEVLDEKMGCSVLISADPEVYDVKIVQVRHYVYYLFIQYCCCLCNNCHCELVYHNNKLFL